MSATIQVITGYESETALVLCFSSSINQNPTWPLSSSAIKIRFFPPASASVITAAPSPELVEVPKDGTRRGTDPE